MGPKKDVFWIIYYTGPALDQDMALAYTSDNVQGVFCHGMFNVGVQYLF